MAIRVGRAGIGVASVLLAFTAQAAEPPLPAAETIRYTWNGGPYQYILTVEQAPGTEGSPRLRIVAPGGRTLVVSVEGGLWPLADSRVPAAVLAGNLLASPTLLLTSKLRGPHGTPALLVFGPGFASDAGSIRVVSLDASGVPRVAFSDDTFQLASIEQDGRGGLLLGNRSLTQPIEACLTTYDPITAIRFGPALATARPDPDSSRAATLRLVGVWAGPTAREDVLVAHRPGAQPRLVPARDASNACR